MRVDIQRVSEATVQVFEQDGSKRKVGRIGPGLLALAGFAPGDDEESLRWMAHKLIGLRLFEGPGGALDLALEDVEGELLIVSQFTLYGDARKGRRPDFGSAASYDSAQALYKRFCELCETRLPDRVQTGVFGAKMAVTLINDGPVTLWLEK